MKRNNIKYIDLLKLIIKKISYLEFKINTLLIPIKQFQICLLANTDLPTLW